MPEIEDSVAEWRRKSDPTLEARRHLRHYLDACQAISAETTGTIPESDVMAALSIQQIIQECRQGAFDLMACSDTLPSSYAADIRNASRDHIIATVRRIGEVPDAGFDINDDLRVRIDLAAVAMKLGIWYEIRETVRAF